MSRPCIFTYLYAFKHTCSNDLKDAWRPLHTNSIPSPTGNRSIFKIAGWCIIQSRIAGLWKITREEFGNQIYQSFAFSHGLQHSISICKAIDLPRWNEAGRAMRSVRRMHWMSIGKNRLPARHPLHISKRLFRVSTRPAVRPVAMCTPVQLEYRFGPRKINTNWNYLVRERSQRLWIYDAKLKTIMENRMLSRILN